MLNKKSPFSRREKLLISILLVAIMLTGFLKLGGPSFFSEIVSNRSARGRLNLEIEELDLILANERSIKTSWAGLQPEWRKLETLLPPVGEQSIVIGAFEDLLERVPGKIYLMRINERTIHESYSNQNLFVKIVDLEAFPYDFLQELEEFPQLLTVDHLEWQIDREGQGTLSISLNLYFAD